MKKICMLLAILLLLFTFTGCERLAFYKDDMIKQVTVFGTNGSLCEIEPERCEKLATLLLKELDMEGRGQTAESDYSDYLSVGMVVGRLTYQFYIHQEGTIVRTTDEVGDRPLEVYDTKMAEEILKEIDRLTAG